MIALLERPVQLHLADHAAQGRLRKLGDCDHEIARAIGRELRVGHLKIEDTVHLQLRIVFGDADLAWNIKRYFAQIVLVSDAVDKRNHEIQSGREHGMESSPTFDNQRMLLRNDTYRLGDNDDDNQEQCQCDDPGTHQNYLLHD